MENTVWKHIDLKILIFTLSMVLADLGFPQAVRNVGFNTSGTNVTLTTTSETVIISSGPVTTPSQTSRVVILAYAQLTTGAATTTVTARIRRGTTTAGTLVGEANAETIGAAAGSTEPYFIVLEEDRADTNTVEYSLTLTQVSATGNGTALQATILVVVL